MSPLRNLEARNSDGSFVHKRSPSRLKSNSLSPADHHTFPPKHVTSNSDQIPVSSLHNLSPALPKNNLCKASSMPCGGLESVGNSPCSALAARNSNSANQSIPSSIPANCSRSESISILVASSNSIPIMKTCANENQSLLSSHKGAEQNTESKHFDHHSLSHISSPFPHDVNDEQSQEYFPSLATSAELPRHTKACLPVDCDSCPLSPTQIHACESSMRSPPQVTRWAQRPSRDSLKFIDEEGDDGGSLAVVKDMALSPIDELTTKHCTNAQRSFSIPSNKAHATAGATPLSLSQLQSHCALTSALSLPETDASKRVVLSQFPASTPLKGEYSGRDTPVHRYSVLARGSGIDVMIDKSSSTTGSTASLDSMDSEGSCFSINSREPTLGCFSSPVCSPKFSRKFPFVRRNSEKKRARASSATRAEEKSAKRQELCVPSQHSMSVPSSPVPRSTGRSKSRNKVTCL